jgi:hypothetical protein
MRRRLALGAALLIIGAGLLFYFMRHKEQSVQPRLNTADESIKKSQEDLADKLKSSSYAFSEKDSGAFVLLLQEYMGKEEYEKAKTVASKIPDKAKFSAGSAKYSTLLNIYRLEEDKSSFEDTKAEFKKYLESSTEEQAKSLLGNFDKSFNFQTEKAGDEERI